MRLQLILPQVVPTEIQPPTKCRYEGCDGRHFEFHQAVEKPLRDTRYREVEAHRYECLRCGRTFRVYPRGVTRAQTSLRVKGLAVLLYLLGLSYGAVSLALEALGVYLCKNSVYETVQAVAERVSGMKRERVFEGLKTPALGGDLTSVKVQGQWLTLGLTVDDISGLVLTIDDLSAEDAETLREWLDPIAKAVEAKILVTDDADALKSAADELGLDQQVCKGHVQRNTESLVESLQTQAATDADGSLADIGIAPEQAVADLKQLDELVHTRRPEDVDKLADLHLSYIDASPPKAGEKATVAYRLRLLFLDRWNLWSRLTRYRSWRGPNGETIDGTNNGSERAIGWWVKERYRTMRGYKRKKSAVNVSRLLAWCGNHLDRGEADLSLLLA
jgi:transposase-like protein